jgi:hypothetical protein
MKAIKIELTENLSLSGVIKSIIIEGCELKIESTDKISWDSASAIAKSLIKKGHSQITKVKFKELITW